MVTRTFENAWQIFRRGGGQAPAAIVIKCAEQAIGNGDSAGEPKNQSMDEGRNHASGNDE
jgi:hypothetical protein